MDIKLLRWFIINFLAAFIVFLVFMEISSNDLYAIILLVVLIVLSVKLLPRFAEDKAINKIISIIILVLVMFFVANSWLGLVEIVIYIAAPVLFYYAVRHHQVTGKILPGKKVLLIILAVVVVLLLFLNYLGLFWYLNEPLNELKGTPRTDCVTDDDCMLRRVSCAPCQCSGTAVSEEWKPFCPFKEPLVQCKMCPDDSVARCVENTCKAVFE
ncbi:hypothetical protein KY328_02440 [Candidatus Woesearchaeota archaeon]|nr:hypothetical protein [Candidatus Woesearchaeota archaeon]MBW3021750.1 hypothetical protein [Candidatus Woesearchaeota archaeon]